MNTALNAALVAAAVPFVASAAVAQEMGMSGTDAQQVDAGDPFPGLLSLCPVSMIGQPCDPTFTGEGGTPLLVCVLANCSGSTCGVCEGMSATYCPPTDDGKPCGDGGICHGCVHGGGCTQGYFDSNAFGMGTTISWQSGTCVLPADTGTRVGTSAHGGCSLAPASNGTAFRDARGFERWLVVFGFGLGLRRRAKNFLQDRSSSDRR
jgi:hypothetical protein